MQIKNRLALARSISEFGNSFRYAALALAILHINNSPADVITGEIVESIGFFVGGMLIPFFIDRYSQLKSLIFIEMLSVLCSSLLIYATITENLTLLLSGAGTIAALSLYHTSLLRSLTAKHTGGSYKEIFKGLNGLSIAIFIGGIIGSTFASTFISKVSYAVLLSVDALSFIVSGAIIFLSIKKEKSVIPPKKHNLFFEWYEGAKFCSANPNVLLPVIAQMILGVSHGFHQALVIPLLKTSLNLSDTFVALKGISNRVASLGASIYLQNVNLTLATKLCIGTAVLVASHFLNANISTFYILIPIATLSVGMNFLAPANNAFIAFQTPNDIKGRVETFRSVAIDIGVLSGQVLCLKIYKTLGIQQCYYLAAVFVIVHIFLYLPIRQKVLATSSS